jgi:hypothetical protein
MAGVDGQEISSEKQHPWTRTTSLGGLGRA